MFKRLIRLPNETRNAAHGGQGKKKATAHAACPKCGAIVGRKALANHLAHSCPGPAAKRRSSGSGLRDPENKRTRTARKKSSRLGRRSDTSGPDRSLLPDRRPSLHVCPDCGMHMRPDQVPYHLCAD
jgi:predicted RNA-binding Zn-ribbon protein involved in translation (DUF1610 family)